MGPVSHTVRLTVLGINGITVSSCAPGRDGGIGTVGEDVRPVSAFVSFSRNKAVVTTLPSKPLGASPEGIELDIPDSDSEDEFGEHGSKGPLSVGRGMRHVALWGFQEESYMSQGCSLAMQVKLHKKGLSFERKEVDVTVGLVHDDETIILASSVLNITGPVPSMQFDLPLRRAPNDFAEGAGERRNIFGGRSTPRAGTTPRTENYGVGVLSSRGSQQEENVLGFSSDHSRRYGLDPDATVRVMVSVITTKEYNEITREQEAARDVIIQQMAMAQANHLGQPVIVNNLSAESPISSISHTVFSSSGDAASVRSRSSKRTQQSHHTNAQSRKSDACSRKSESTRSRSSSRRSNSRSRSSSERSLERHNQDQSRERSAHLPPRASGRTPQPNTSASPNPNPTSPRQALQLTPFSPTLTQTGRVKKGSNAKPPRPSPPIHMPMPNTPEQHQGKGTTAVMTPLEKKMDSVDGSQFFSPIAIGVKEGGSGASQGGGGGRFSPRISLSTPKTPKAFKLKKVFKALTPRTGSSNNSLSSTPNTPTAAMAAAGMTAQYDPSSHVSPNLANLNMYDKKSSQLPMDAMNAYGLNSSPSTNEPEEIADHTPIPISGTVGNSSSNSMLRGSGSNNENCEYVSLRSRSSVDMGSFMSRSPPQDSASKASLTYSKHEKITVETATSLSDDFYDAHLHEDFEDNQNENLPINPGPSLYHTEEEREPDPAYRHFSEGGGAPQFSNKKLEELGIPLSKEKSLYEKLVSGFFCKDELNAAKCVNEQTTENSGRHHPPKFVVAKMNSDESVGDLTLTTLEQRTNGGFGYKNLVPAACGGSGVCVARQQHIGLLEVPEDEDYGDDLRGHLSAAASAASKSRGRKSADIGGSNRSESGRRRPKSHHTRDDNRSRAMSSRRSAPHHIRGNSTRSRSSNIAIREDELSVGDETMESIEAAKSTPRKHADMLGANASYRERGSEHGDAVRDERDLWNTFDNVCRTSGSNIGRKEERSDDESLNSSSSSSDSSARSSDSSVDDSTLFDDEDMKSRRKGRKSKRDISRGGLVSKTPPGRTQGVSRRYRQRETAQ